MKILLTGAAGFLGRVVLKKMLDSGTGNIRVLVRNAESEEIIRSIIGSVHNDQVEVFTGDYSVPEDAERSLAGVEKLIHVAAALKGTSSNIFGNNVVGSRVMLESILRSGTCRDILLVSSLGVYGLWGLPKNAKVDEDTPVDPNPEKRDLYTYSKVWQEKMFRNYQYKNGEKKYNLCIVRPGPIYGSGGTVLPARLGLHAHFVFLNFGNGNYIPLTYVDNCADAIIYLSKKSVNGTVIYNIIDSDVPTATQYIRKYRIFMKKFRCISIPFSFLMILSEFVERYSERSGGQIPPFLTKYKTENMWKRIRYDNSKLMKEGFKQNISTEEGLSMTFRALQNRPNIP